MAETETEVPPEEQVETIEFGLWWPSADPGDLRQAARAWRAMADALEAAARELRGHAAEVAADNRGRAVDAFSSYIEGWTGTHLPTAAENCRAIATAFTDYADAVDNVRDQIRQMAIEIAATVAVGVGLAFFTAGLSAGAAAGNTAAMVARAGLLATSMAARVIAICSRIVAFAGVGALEGGATNLVIQTGRNAITNPNHDPFSGYDAGEVGWSVAGGAVVGSAFGALRAVPIMRGVEPAVDSSRPPFGVTGATRSSSALKIDPHHGFADLVDHATAGSRRTLILRRGPGGAVVGQDELMQRGGSLNGVDGVFEWIVRNGEVVHRRFIPRGVVNGVPNQVPPKPGP
ncbi:MAG: WXG100 family type VII secretion target [Acidimicrobiales bacterium]